MALKGVAWALSNKGKHLIVSQAEHSAVLESAEQLGQMGFEVTYLPVDEFGFVDSELLRSAIRKDTILVSLIYANNEIGTIQDIAALGAVCKEKGVLFHTDACQAANFLELDMDKLGVDLLTLNAGKIYGPKGVGVLAVKDLNLELWPVVSGGGQEFGLRSGTENVPGIVGMAEALKLVREVSETEAVRLAELRDLLWQGLVKEIPKCWSTGSFEAGKRLPNHLSMVIEDIEGESLLLRLDNAGVAASTGSACSSGSLEPSHVLKAIGLRSDQTFSSLRLTLGKSTTREQVEQAIRIIAKEVKGLREIGSLF